MNIQKEELAWVGIFLSAFDALHSEVVGKTLDKTKGYGLIHEKFMSLFSPEDRAVLERAKILADGAILEMGRESEKRRG